MLRYICSKIPSLASGGADFLSALFFADAFFAMFSSLSLSVVKYSGWLFFNSVPRFPSTALYGNGEKAPFTVICGFPPNKNGGH
jgi:hypothetical protein